jgi:hypothetical protein
MNWHKFSRRALVSIVSGGALTSGVADYGQADVVIHNNGFTADNQALPGGPSYGSNAASNDANWSVAVGAWGITGAPDISLFWDGEGGGSSGNGLDTYINWNGRGNVVQLDSSAGGTPNFSVLFTPSANYAVSIRSFDLDAWAGGGNMVVDWSIQDANNSVLASGQWTKGNEGGRDRISPDFVGSVGQSLALRLNRLSGLGSYLAIDNLTFAQAVPEPSSAVLVLSGLGALAMRRRKTQS